MTTSRPSIAKANWNLSKYNLWLISSTFHRSNAGLSKFSQADWIKICVPTWIKCTNCIYLARTRDAIPNAIPLFLRRNLLQIDLPDLSCLDPSNYGKESLNSHFKWKWNWGWKQYFIASGNRHLSLVWWVFLW